MTTSNLQTGVAYVVNSVTHSDLRPLSTPADGDNYTYEPSMIPRASMIPPQWVSVGEYKDLFAEVQSLRQRVAELEKMTSQWQGDG